MRCRPGDRHPGVLDHSSVLADPRRPEGLVCIFPSVQALPVLKQLKVGSLVLIDVFTAKGAFSFSLTPKGYQAGISQIRAWGYRTE
jgi:hypothetical protein